MSFSPDYSVASLFFVGLADPVVLHLHGGYDKLALGFSETLCNQRMVDTSTGRTVFLNYPFMLALQEYIEPPQ